MSFQVLHCNHFRHTKRATYDNTLIIKVFGHAALATGTARPDAQVAQVVRLVLLVVHGQRNLSAATPAQNKKGETGNRSDRLMVIVKSKSDLIKPLSTL